MNVCWIEFGDLILFRTSYPVLPWIGVIALGYCIGHTVFNSTHDVAKRNQILLGFGLASISLFIILRMINLYGDQAWSIMSTSTETVMSFLNLTKYSAIAAVYFVECRARLSPVSVTSKD